MPSRPDHDVTCGLIGGAAGAGLGLLPVLFAMGYGDYGAALLVGVPFLAGFGAVFFRPGRERVEVSDALATAGWSLLGMSAVLLLAAFEGAVCILMVAPIALLLAILGALAGRGVRNARIGPRPPSVSLLVAIAPLALSAAMRTPDWEERTVVTERFVAASPEAIWPYVGNIEAYPEPEFWLFRMGVAHPVATRTEGKRRVCVLSTGEMPERILEQVPNRRLRFVVLSTPPCVRETNPFGEVRAAHDRGWYECREGLWELTPVAGGTRLRTTSRYRHRFGLPLYWDRWTDAVVRAVHVRVLDEIARRTTSREKPPQ